MKAGCLQVSLATLKTKIEQLIDNSKYLNCLNEDYKYGLSRYFVPKNKTDWSNFWSGKLNGSPIIIESEAKPIDIGGAFANGTSLNTIVIDFETSQVQDYSEAFAGKGGRQTGFLEIQGELDFTNCTVAVDCFTKCSKLKEVRFKANSISYAMWDLDFSATDDLSEESLLSIANACIPTPDDVPDGNNGYIVFSSTTITNMPQYIREIFKTKRYDLG